MTFHPATYMLCIWTFCSLLQIFLPFGFDEMWHPHETGLLSFLAFFLAFLLGTFMISDRSQDLVEHQPSPGNIIRVEITLMVASGLASVLMVLDFNPSLLLDLSEAARVRNEAAAKAAALETSSSSLLFKLAFLFYPAAFVYIVFNIVYSERLIFWKITLFGLLPIILSSVSSGGRASLLYIIVVGGLAIHTRRRLYKPQKLSKKIKFLVSLLLLAFLIASFYYFILVFVNRALNAGGMMHMFEYAQTIWGVSFIGPTSELIFSILGENFTYLLFIFSWYLTQGLAVSSAIFSNYDGQLMFGAYGVDIIMAILRRADPAFVRDGFDNLFNIGTYGFFPSAWGSLYVDFGFFGILASFCWGLLTSLCFQKIIKQKRIDWFFIGPFVTAGILFSIINTPLGFNNGLITHLWLLFAFILLRHSDKSLETAKAQKRN